jgi:hypothetical protein
VPAVLAVFVGTCAIGIITTIVAYNGGAAGDTANSTGTVIHQPSRGLPSDPPIAAIPDTAINQLTSIPGVEGVTAIHVQRTSDSASASGFTAVFFVSCDQIRLTAALIVPPAFGACGTRRRRVVAGPHGRDRRPGGPGRRPHESPTRSACDSERVDMLGRRGSTRGWAKL